jgi:hypothetical protein
VQMKTEDHWHCTNSACGCEVRVQNRAIADGTNPRCSCGAVMKKRYASPALTYLDFLRLEKMPNVAAREG